MTSATTARTEPRTVSQLLFNPISMWLAVAVLAASVSLPTAGLGIDLCWFKAISGLPCPGCGLTRSVTNVSHLDLAAAVRYHPFGPIVWLLFTGLVAANVAGEARRVRVGRWLARHERIARRIYLAFVYAFVGFGFIRLAAAAFIPGAFEGI